MSKLGPHTESAGADALAWAERAGIVKQFFSGTALLAAAPSSAVKVFRTYWPNQPYYAGAGKDAANRIIAELKGYNDPNLFVELYNEPNQADTPALCIMIQEAVPILHAAGLRLAAFSWGTGQPEDAVWTYVQSQNWCDLDFNRDAIALHEYSNNWQIDGWNMGRFKRLLAIRPGTPILVTETGFDTGGGNAGGWRIHGTEDQFYAFMGAYDDLLERSPDVLGATIFTADPTTDWSNFEFHDPRAMFSKGDSSTMADDPRIQQILDQNAFLAKALYDIVKALSVSGVAGNVDLIQDAKTNVNALNPNLFTF